MGESSWDRMARAAARTAERIRDGEAADVIDATAQLVIQASTLQQWAKQGEQDDLNGLYGDEAREAALQRRAGRTPQRRD